MRSDILNSSSQSHNKDTINLIYSQDADDTLSLGVEESGSLVLLRNCGAAKLINLPPASGNAGVYYDLLLHETLSAHTTTIQAKDGTDYFIGTVADGEAATTAQYVLAVGDVYDQLVVAASATGGEFEARIVCDGSNWYLMNAISQDISDITGGTSSSNTRTA